MGEREVIETGRRQAERVLASRRARREKARKRGREPAAPVGVAGVDPEFVERVRRELGPLGERWLVAEGDSWFSFPFTDVLDELERTHHFEIESVSRFGHTVEEMAYGAQVNDLVGAIEKVLRLGHVPEAILLSAGGNDVAAVEFSFLLNHAESPRSGLNDSIVTGLVNGRIRDAYLTLLGAIAGACEGCLGQAIPVLLHGYDYGVPDGRGTFFGLVAGPWLEPGFRRKGYGADEGPRDPVPRMVEQLIDRFNEMLIELPRLQGLGHVRHVDLRDTLGRGSDYKDWWADELHPTPKGFAAIAQKFADALRG